MGTRLWRTSLHLQLLAGRHTLQARAHHEQGQEDAAHKDCVRRRGRGERRRVCERGRRRAGGLAAGTGEAGAGLLGCHDPRWRARARPARSDPAAAQTPSPRCTRAPRPPRAPYPHSLHVYSLRARGGQRRSEGAGGGGRGGGHARSRRSLVARHALRGRLAHRGRPSSVGACVRDTRGVERRGCLGGGKRARGAWLGGGGGAAPGARSSGWEGGKWGGKVAGGVVGASATRVRCQMPFGRA